MQVVNFSEIHEIPNCFWRILRPGKMGLHSLSHTWSQLMHWCGMTASPLTKSTFSLSFSKTYPTLSNSEARCQSSLITSLLHTALLHPHLSGLASTGVLDAQGTRWGSSKDHVLWRLHGALALAAKNISLSESIFKTRYESQPVRDI